MAHRDKSSDVAPGNHWVEVLAALVNGVGLVAIALWIGWEAVDRLQSPPVEILSLPMLATASVGLGVNSVNIFLLHKDSHDDLNLKGAFLHILADAASSVGVIVAAIAVWALNWMWADGVISLLVSGLIIISATPLIIQSLNALFAKSPKEVFPDNQ
jgi:cobalt-zinc-cadmium efflux system protein